MVSEEPWMLTWECRAECDQRLAAATCCSCCRGLKDSRRDARVCAPRQDRQTPYCGSGDSCPELNLYKVASGGGKMVETGGVRSAGSSPVSSSLPPPGLPLAGMAASLAEPLVPTSLPCLAPLPHYPYPAYLHHLSQYMGAADPIKQYLAAGDPLKHYLTSEHLKYLLPEHMRLYLGHDPLKGYHASPADHLKVPLQISDPLKNYASASEHLRCLASGEVTEGGGLPPVSRAQSSVFTIESLLAPRTSSGAPRLPPSPFPTIPRTHYDLLGKPFFTVTIKSLSLRLVLETRVSWSWRGSRHLKGSSSLPRAPPPCTLPLPHLPGRGRHRVDPAAPPPLTP